MTRPAASADPDRITKGWRPAIAALVTFAVFGPPIGGFFAGASFGVLDLAARPDVRLLEIIWESLFAGLAAMTLGAIFAYWFGGLQAAAVGGVAALFVWRQGKVALWIVLIAAALTGMILAPQMRAGLPQRMLMFSTHIFAAAICWIILRRVLDRWYD